jgi:hypothetical protein
MMKYYMYIVCVFSLGDVEPSFGRVGIYTKFFAFALRFAHWETRGFCDGRECSSMRHSHSCPMGSMKNATVTIGPYGKQRVPCPMTNGMTNTYGMNDLHSRMDVSPRLYL